MIFCKGLDVTSVILCRVDNTTYYFIILIRKDTQVICTQMLSTHEPMMRGSLDFPNLIKINGITGDFRLDLEIYGMVSMADYFRSWMNLQLLR